MTPLCFILLPCSLCISTPVDRARLAEDLLGRNQQYFGVTAARPAPTGLQPDTRSVETLVAGLESADAGTRARAACALRRLGGRAARSIDALVRVLGDSSPVSGQECGEADIVIPGSGSREVRTTIGREAGRALAAIGRAAVPALVTLVDSDADLTALRHAIWVLGLLKDDRAVASLARHLQHELVDVRRDAAYALGTMNASQSVSALSAALRDADARVRANAAWSLGQLRDLRAIHALGQALVDSDVQVRRNVAWALAGFEHESARAALEKAQHDADELVRREAARALGGVRR